MLTHFPARAGGGAGHPGRGVRAGPGPGRVGYPPGRRGGVRAPPSVPRSRRPPQDVVGAVGRVLQRASGEVCVTLRYAGVTVTQYLPDKNPSCLHTGSFHLLFRHLIHTRPIIRRWRFLILLAPSDIHSCHEVIRTAFDQFI
jgi:hypothetical protein